MAMAGATGPSPLHTLGSSAMERVIHVYLVENL